MDILHRNPKYELDHQYITNIIIDINQYQSISIFKFKKRTNIKIVIGASHCKQIDEFDVVKTAKTSCDIVDESHMIIPRLIAEL